MASEHQANALLLERQNAVRHLRPFEAIGGDHMRSPVGTKHRGSDATASHPYHDDPFATEIHASFPACQRSLRDDKLTSASKIEMIQKRTMTLGSGHPFFSK